MRSDTKLAAECVITLNSGILKGFKAILKYWHGSVVSSLASLNFDI